MQKDHQQVEALCKNFNLEKGLISNLAKSQASWTKFQQVVQVSGLSQSEKRIGNMLYSIATKLPVIIDKFMNMLAEKVGKGDIYNPNQLDYAIEYLINAEKQGGVDIDQFNKACGVGIKHTNEEIAAMAENQIKEANNESVKVEWFLKFKANIPYVEGKIMKDIFDEVWKKRGLPQNVQKKKEKKKQQIKSEAQAHEVIHIKDISQLIGREMKSAVNSKQNLQLRYQKFGNGILTRFPPQPNGYLHIGHAKAMRFNFMQAKTTNGHCYLRFDDTNPLKQNMEYIENIKQNIHWMGYQPWKVTHASDNFDHLFNFAITLIKQGNAFVCSESPSEMKANRSEGKPSKDRDRSIDENLILFEEMRLGMYEENQYCLRAKIDYKSANTTLRDPVIYRVRYTSHPHVGNKWCIYPLYDFTHCICDSLEGISHSLCSLEFEIRRELYYWFLEKLDLYKPNVWQYSRLNITYTVLSKRKLHELVFTNRVRGWDDPRILTINGMRRRGYPAQAINSFCDQIGVTRRGNQNFINFNVLQNQVRKNLDIHAPRTMAVLDPVQLIIDDLTQQQVIAVPLFPKNEEKGHRNIKFSKRLYVDRQNVKLVDEPNFLGIAPNKVVGLKYASTILIKEIKSENGKVTQVIAQLDKNKVKPGSFLHWISVDQTFECEARVYGLLFNCEKPNDEDNYLDFLNKDSQTIYKNVKCHHDLLKVINILDRWQFERKGFFCVDKDSKIEEGKIVWNMTVGLQQNKKKK